MRRLPLAIAAVAAVAAAGSLAPAAFAGPRAYDMSAMLAASHPFEREPCCGLWPDAGPVRPTLPPGAGLRGYDVRPLLERPHPFADRPTGWRFGAVQPAPPFRRGYDMTRLLAEPHPFDAAARPSPSPGAAARVPVAPPSGVVRARSAPAEPSSAPPAVRGAPASPPQAAPPPRAVRARARDDAPAAVERAPQLYLGGAAGLSALQDADYGGAASFEAAYDPRFHLAGVAGMQFGSGLRLEFELAYRQVAFDSLRVSRAGDLGGLGTGTVSAEGDASVMAFMFNAAWEFDLGWKLRPFVLAGLGPARAAATDVTAGGVEIMDDSAVVVAWQLGLGATIQLAGNWVLDASYRLFSTTDPTFIDSAGGKLETEIMAHDLLIGARYLF